MLLGNNAMWQTKQRWNDSETNIEEDRTVRRFRTQTGDPGARFKQPSSRFRAQNAVYLQGV